MKKYIQTYNASDRLSFRHWSSRQWFRNFITPRIPLL